MPASLVGSASASASGADRASSKLGIKMPSTMSAQRVEAKYDVVLEYPNLELHSAAASGNVGLVHYALTHGQPVNSLLHGCLPLHAASSGGSVSVVRMLIERGADVNAPRLPRRYSDYKRGTNAPAVGTAGSTPLHFAAANGHAPVVQILLAYGAVPDKQDRNGMTAEHLADLSNHSRVAHTIRVWRQMNEAAPSIALNGDGKEAANGAAAAGPSGRPRADSLTSSAWSESSDQTSQQSQQPHVSRKGKERAPSVASVASEKGMRLLRNSIESGFRKQSSPSSVTANTGLLSLTPLTPTPSTPPNPPPPASSTTTQGGEIGEISSSELTPSPFVEDDQAATPSTDLENSPMRSSRRPSLPSIIEKAANSKTAFRTAIRKTEDSSPSIAGSPPSSPPSGNSGFFRSRGRERGNFNKNAILGLFRRGQSPQSRSPSPPRRSEPARALAPEEADANMRRLKRASMDPELMSMAMDMAVLSEQLEAAAVNSAPVTRTRFFEDSASERQIYVPPSSDRTIRPSARKGNGVISPSPLANEWGADDYDDRQATVRRTRTDVRRSAAYPRRIPSEPVMNGLKPRSSTMPSEHRSTPVTADNSSESSPRPLASDADASADDELDQEDVIQSAMPSIEALALAQDSTDSSPVLSIDVPALTLDTPEGDLELTSSTELGEVADMIATTRRHRGESIGSSVTNSSRGVKTPPSVTPPGGNKPVVEEITSLGFITPASPEKRITRSRGHSIGSGFPPVLEHEVSTYAVRKPRKISSHAEARDAMEQTERDVLELAQMPLTEDSHRTLAEQLAAYGDTHALAEELSRTETRLSRGSGSLTSSASGASSDSKRGVRSTSGRHHRTQTSPNLIDVKAPDKVPSITDIYDRRSSSSVQDVYDRRDRAYRDRMQTLASAPIHGLTVRPGVTPTVTRSRTISGEYTARSRATSGSDKWLSPGTPPRLTPMRRLTDPSSSVNLHLADQPLMPSEIIPTQRKSSRSQLGHRQPMSAPVTARGSPAGGYGILPRPGSALSRSSSLHKPNDRVNSMRYQGLAQARQFAAASQLQSQSGSLFGNPYGATTADGGESDDTDERLREYTMMSNDWRSEIAPSRADSFSGMPTRSVSVSGAHGNEYGRAHSNSVGSANSSSGRWGQFKGAIGNLRR